MVEYTKSLFYDSEGNFIPRTASYGNIDGNIAHVRNTYMESEREYFLYLLSFDDIREEFLRCLDLDNESLFEYAVSIMEKIESGTLEKKEELEQMKTMNEKQREEFHMKKLERAEGIMCLLFATIRDKAKILELTLNYEPQEYSHGRSR